jgi:hypothetical protein
VALVAAGFLLVGATPATAADPSRSATAKQEVARAYDGFLRSAGAGHGRATCARLTASGRAEVMHAAGLWSRWRGTCPEAVAALRGVLRNDGALRDVRIFGMRASGSVAPGHYRFFVRAGSGWKVAGTAATNVLLAPAPAPRASPDDFLGVDWPRAQRWAEDATRWRWFAPAGGGALLLLAFGLDLRARRFRRQSVALEQALEEITTRANRVLSSTSDVPLALTLPPDLEKRLTARHDVAALARANRELTARLDELQTRSDEMAKRMLDELSRTGDDHEQASRLRERLARSETARGEAQAEIQALQEHVRRLRERAHLPD